jgi:phosphonate transport system substrate-binding protein
VPTAAGLTFGCVPHTDDNLTRACLVELCSWLGNEIGVTVAPHRSPSPIALASAFGAGRVGLAWVSPALFLTARELEQAAPIACSVRSGLSTYHGVLFVPASSRLRSPSELTGTRVGWVAPTSAAGYIVPRLALASHGLDPRTLFESETFYDSHHEVTRAVFSGRADVGATFALFEAGNATKSILRAGFLDVVPGGKGRILYAAGPIPSDLIVAAPTLPPTLRVRLSRALVGLRSADISIQQAVAHILGADTFEEPRPHAFDALREQIADGRALGLLDDLPSASRIPT